VIVKNDSSLSFSTRQLGLIRATGSPSYAAVEKVPGHSPSQPLPTEPVLSLLPLADEAWPEGQSRVFSALRLARGCLPNFLAVETSLPRPSCPGLMSLVDRNQLSWLSAVHSDRLCSDTVSDDSRQHGLGGRRSPQADVLGTTGLSPGRAPVQAADFRLGMARPDALAQCASWISACGPGQNARSAAEPYQPEETIGSYRFRESWLRIRSSAGETGCSNRVHSPSAHFRFAALP